VSKQSTNNIDSDYLLSLARQKSTESRNTLASTISDLFEDKAETLTDRERALMFDILHNMVKEVELTIRKKLSERLAQVGEVPVELVNILVNDEIDVAYPLLSKSKVLRDMDLIEVIRHRTLEHQLAVAIRENLSEQVSDALVETGEENVIRTLLKNSSAVISSKTMAYLVEQSRRVDSFREPILHRDDLNPALAKRMFLWVSAAMRQFIIQNYKLDDATIDDLMEEVARESATGETKDKELSPTAELAASLEKEGMVTNSMLVKALRQGEIPLFVSLFCRRSQLRETLVLRILFEPGGEGLAIACKALEISNDEFEELFKLSRKARPGEGGDIKGEAKQVLNLYERMSSEAAIKVLKAWQRDMEYLAAIRQLEVDR